MKGFALLTLGVIAIVVITFIDSCRVVIHAAQYNPDALRRSLLFLPGRSAWVLTSDVPNVYKFCAGQDPDGTMRGCVTAAELREKADRERQRPRAPEGLRIR